MHLDDLNLTKLSVSLLALPNPQHRFSCLELFSDSFKNKLNKQIVYWETWEKWCVGSAKKDFTSKNAHCRLLNTLDDTLYLFLKEKQLTANESQFYYEAMKKIASILKNHDKITDKVRQDIYSETVAIAKIYSRLNFKWAIAF